MNLSKEISEIANGANDKPIETPDEVKDVLTDNHDIHDNQGGSEHSEWSKLEYLKGDIDWSHHERLRGNIHKNVTFRGTVNGGNINVSKSCGCNNACTNACSSSCLSSSTDYAIKKGEDIKFTVK